MIAAIQADMETLAAHPYPEDGFVGMKIHGHNYVDKDTAGEALLDAIAEVSETEPVEIGSYRGLTITAALTMFGEHKVNFRGSVAYTMNLGDSAAGNIIRIDNGLNKLPEHLEEAQAKLADLHRQLESAKVEAARPFALEEELQQKSTRLAELDTVLNIGGRASSEEAAA